MKACQQCDVVEPHHQVWCKYASKDTALRTMTATDEGLAHIDAVAEAIWQHDDESRAQRPGMWTDLSYAWQDYYRRMAVAAICAMKDGKPQ